MDTGDAVNAQRDVLVSVEQALVPFYDRDIIAVQLSDSRIAAVLSSLCEALQLATVGQARRIRADDVLREHLLLAQVQTEGGPQAMDVLTAWAIPTWLQGIKLGKVAPEKRPAILAFKREAADALYRHFARWTPALPTPTRLVPAEPIAQPEAPVHDASREAWIRYHEAMAAWLHWQEDIETWRGHVESRLESHEAVLQLVPEILERLGPQTLTPEHQRTVQQCVKRLHEVGGVAYAAIYTELGEQFYVAKYDQLPEARWAEIATWFSVRIDAAEKRAARHRG